MEPATVRQSARTILNVTTGVTGMKKEENTGENVNYTSIVIRQQTMSAEIVP